MNIIIKWFKRQYTKIKMYWKMWKALHTIPDWETWQVYHIWNSDTQIGFKHNPFYFNNMGEITSIDTEFFENENLNDLSENWVLIPFPINDELYKLMNELRID